MSWTPIDKVSEGRRKRSVPAEGVAVMVQRTLACGGQEVRYIKISIGTQLATRLGLKDAGHPARLMLGSAADAGMIGVFLDEDGAFEARRQKGGGYCVTLSARDAEGRFTLDFPRFEIAVCGSRTASPLDGQPAMFKFAASAAMLAGKADNEKKQGAGR